MWLLCLDVTKDTGNGGHAPAFWWCSKSGCVIKFSSHLKSQSLVCEARAKEICTSSAEHVHLPCDLSAI